MNEYKAPDIIKYEKLLGAGSPWSLEEEYLLFHGTCKGKSLEDLSNQHKRSEVAIISRQVKLKLRLNHLSEIVEPLPNFIPTTKLNFEKISTNTISTNNGKILVRSEQFFDELNQLLNNEGNTPLDKQEIMSDPVEALWNALKKDIINLKKRIYSNKEREIKILFARLNPDPNTNRKRTLQDLGSEFSISRERIRQIVKKGKRKLFNTHHLKTRNMGQVLKVISNSYDLDDKSNSQIVNWYLSLFIEKRCDHEFVAGLLNSIKIFHEMRGINFKDLVAKYKEDFSKLQKLSKKTEKKEVNQGQLIKKANEFVYSVLRTAEFSGTFAKNLEDLSVFRPLRNVKNERTFFSESLRKLVQWESQGELKLIKAMENSDIIKEYVEQPIQIEYAFNGKHIYIPDFLIRTEEGLVFILEVKFRKQLADYLVLQKAKAAIKYLGKIGVGYCLLDQKGFSINDLKKVEVPPDFKSFLRHTLVAKRFVDFNDLYSFFGGPPEDIAFDQMQSLAINYPDKVRYISGFKTKQNTKERGKFYFQLKWI